MVMGVGWGRGGRGGWGGNGGREGVGGWSVDASMIRATYPSARHHTTVLRAR